MNYVDLMTFREEKFLGRVVGGRNGLLFLKRPCSNLRINIDQRATGHSTILGCCAYVQTEH